MRGHFLENKQSIKRKHNQPKNKESSTSPVIENETTKNMQAKSNNNQQ